MRRVGWLQAMLRDETNHAQPRAAIFGRFLGKDVLEEKEGDSVREQTRLPLPSIGTCTCLKDSRAQRSIFEALRKHGFQSALCGPV